MNKVLENISTIIERYESGSYISTDDLREMLRLLSANIYHLTKYKIEYKNKHNEVLYKNKKSLGFGEILAHEMYPELYQIRYILRSAHNVLNSLRSEIGIIRSEN